MYTLYKGAVRRWTQGRYECLHCLHKGRFRHEMELHHRCQHCSSQLILALPDFELVVNPAPPSAGLRLAPAVELLGTASPVIAVNSEMQSALSAYVAEQDKSANMPKED